MDQRSFCSIKGNDSQTLPSPHDSESEECKRPDTEEQCEFVRCHRMAAEDEEPLFGPLHLKDGLFCSLRSVAVGTEFLKTYKISHIVAIDDGPQRPFNDLQGGVETDESTPTVPPRHLRFQWEQKGRSIDPAAVKQKLKDLATAVAFIDEAVEQGGSCLLHSSNELGTAAAAATVYFIVKFGWNLGRCIKFLSNRRPPLHLQPSALALLKSAERQRLVLQSLAGTSPATEAECLLLHNTIANAIRSVLPTTTHTVRRARRPHRALQWFDMVDINDPRQQQDERLCTSIRKAHKQHAPLAQVDSLRRSNQTPRSILKRIQPSRTTVNDPVRSQHMAAAGMTLEQEESSSKGTLAPRPTASASSRTRASDGLRGYKTAQVGFVAAFLLLVVHALRD